ncbi:DNA-directed RNA polymerase sigma-70 factor [Acetobacter pasteurianus NBRC 101655]|nr:DNA-directed RNA polymerase sigma-70 factor [Acetobacter pasteurianus NBRC 101655]
MEPLGGLALDGKRTSLELYQTHRATLLSYATRLSGDKTVAEDIVQDVWLLFSRQRVETIAAPLNYLRTIVRNLVITRVRKEGVENTAGSDFEAVTAEIADDQVSPEENVASREAMKRIVDAIAAMPDPRQRQAIRMYHFEGLKLREIAVHLDLSLTRVHGLIEDGMAICDRVRKEGQ